MGTAPAGAGFNTAAGGAAEGLDPMAAAAGFNSFMAFGHGMGAGMLGGVVDMYGVPVSQEPGPGFFGPPDEGVSGAMAGAVSTAPLGLTAADHPAAMAAALRGLHEPLGAVGFGGGPWGPLLTGRFEPHQPLHANLMGHPPPAPGAAGLYALPNMDAAAPAGIGGEAADPQAMAAMATAAAATGLNQPEGFATLDHAGSSTWAGLQQRQHSSDGSKAGDPAGIGSEANLGSFSGLRSVSRAGSSNDGKDGRMSEPGTGTSLGHSNGSAGAEAVTPRGAGLPAVADSGGAGGSSTGRQSAGRPPPHPPHSGSSAASGGVWRAPGLPFMAAAPASPYQAYRGPPLAPLMIPALDPTAVPPPGDHPSAGSGHGHAAGSGLDTGSSAAAPGSLLGSPQHRQAAAGFGCCPPQSPAASPMIGPFGPLFHPMSPGAPFLPYGPLPGVPAFVPVPPSPVRILKSRSGAAVPYMEMGGTETIGRTPVGAVASTGPTRAPYASPGGTRRSPKVTNRPHSLGSSPGFQRQPHQWQVVGSIASAGPQASAQAPADSDASSQGSISRMPPTLNHSPRICGSSSRSPVGRSDAVSSAVTVPQQRIKLTQAQHHVTAGVATGSSPASFATTVAPQAAAGGDGQAGDDSMIPAAYGRSPSMALLTAIPEAAAEDGRQSPDVAAPIGGKGGAADRPRSGHSGAAAHHHQQLNSVLDPVVSPGRITIASKVKAARLYSQSAGGHHPGAPGNSSGGGSSSRLSGSKVIGQGAHSSGANYKG
eukprot:gene5620-5858_t